MNNKFKKIVAVLAALAILTSGWYFFYWLKTPQHSIALIADAVRLSKSMSIWTICTAKPMTMLLQ